jgi:YD repeat-containing protein
MMQQSSQSSDRCTRLTRVTVLLTVIGLGAASIVHAQDTGPNDPGFQPNRDYLSLLPWESIDTSNNNVILSFTDLVLPGNAGRELRFERVFTNVVALGEDPAGPQWRFGIRGVPMQVVERPYITTTLPRGNLEAERNTTPYFWMLDGSRLKTTYVVPPDPGNSSTLVNVRTHDFWFYHRPSRTLSIPDGRVAEYNAQGRLTRIRDVFDADGTNVVTLAWLTDAQGTINELQVTQSLGNGESRVITIRLDAATGLPTELAYNGRTWSYRYNARGLLETVELPLGAGAPRWTFEYSNDQFSIDKITRVVTPQGGAVAYGYADRTFHFGSTTATFNVLDVRRVYDHDGAPAGEWTFSHFPSPAGSNDVTEVTLPSQTKVTYQYGAYADPNALAGTWQLRFRTVESPSGAQIEHEERQYTAGVLRAARLAEPWGVPRIARRLVKRAGQTYTTEYTYSGSTQPYFHEFHRPITITERGPAGTVERATQLTYQHVIDEAYVLGLPATESVTVAGMTMQKSWGYDAATGFRQSETVYGITTVFGADALGNIATATKANGKTTSFTYRWGVIEDTTSAEVIIDRMINSDGAIASETIAGRTTTYEYDDPLGRLTRIQPPGSANATTTSYDDANRAVTVRRGNSLLTTITDGFGRPVETVNGVAVRTRTAYDAEGRTTYRSYPYADMPVGTEFTYDSLGRVIEERNSGDQTTRSRTYDDATNSIIVRDETNHATVMTYRGFGHPDDARLVKVMDANQQEWTYSYDAIGNLAQVVTPTGHTRTWIRNTSGLLTSETQPESGSVLYTQYDAAGVLKRKVDARGTTFVYQHDGNDRITRITAGTSVTNIGYEVGSDNRASMSSGSVSTSFFYDAAGRLARRHDVIGAYVFDSQYAYDGNDQVVAITYPSGRVIGYERGDAEGRITRVFETAAGRDYAFGMTYHPSGALATYTAGNGIATTVTYDPARYWVRGIESGYLQLTYGGYDGAGNVGAISDSRSGMGQTFTYDALHRLATANGPYGSTGYAYDPHGNRQTNATGTYVYDPDTLRLTAQNGVPFGYDQNGNLTSTSTATYTYTPENWLATSNAAGSDTAYFYDGDGWRARKTVTGETTLYLRGPSGELLTEWHDLGATARARDYVYAGARLLSAIDRPVSPLSTCGGGAIPDGSPTSLTVPAGGTATLRFEGSACRRVSVFISASTVANCGLINHRLRILNPNGSVLAWSSDGICAGAMVGPVVLPTSGTYTVSVYAYGSAGTVTVRVYDIVDVTGPIAVGQAVNVTLNAPGQRGYWTFSGSQNQRVSAVIGATSLINCGPYNTFKIVSGGSPDGTVIGTSGFDGLCAGTIIGPVTLPANGVYTVVVDPYSSYTGQFAVSVYNVVDVTGPISLDGSPLTAALNTPGQRARWTFNGTAGQRVSAVVAASNIQQCGAYNSFGFLKPDGSALYTQWDMCAGAIAGPVTLPTTGTYTVLADPAGAFTGQITVKAYNVVDVTGPVTVNGAAVTAALTVPGQRGLWTFSGTAGQKVRAVVNLSTLPWCAIYNSFGILKPDGTGLGTQWDMCAGALTAQLTLPTNGTYTLIADPWGSNTGIVTARVIDPVVLVNGVPPPTGVTVAPSALVAVQVVGGTGNTADQVRLSVVGSGGGAYLQTKPVPTSGSPVSFTMPATPGTYQFRLFANGSAWIATSTTVTVQ